MMRDYKEQINNAVKYDDPKKVKELYKHYNDFKQLSYLNGDSTISSIYIDLKYALRDKSLTNKQLQCIKEVLINNTDLREVAILLNMSHMSVKRHLDAGIKNIIKILNNEEE